MDSCRPRSVCGAVYVYPYKFFWIGLVGFSAGGGACLSQTFCIWCWNRVYKNLGIEMYLMKYLWA